jgi:hypothetical protein
MSTNGTHHTADEAIDSLYSYWPGQQPAPAPCPEALFSLTLKGTMGGQDALLTVRGQSAAEFQQNLEAVRGLLDAKAPQPQIAGSETPEGWCSLHHVQMLHHTNAKGQWYSHYLGDGKHCKGK